VSVTGQIDVASLRGAVDVTKLRVTLYPITSSAQWEMPIWREIPDATGRFTARQVSPGRFSVRVDGLPAGWSLASAVFGGRETADHHLFVEAGKSYAGKLTFTDRTSEVNGTVLTPAGTPSAQHTVIVFPTDREMWIPSSRRIQALQPAADGKFTARGLPAGDYRVIAVLDPDNGAWFNADYLATLVTLSTPVTLGEGDRKTTDIKVR